jgi:DNA-3-methyladenine glycosylase II
VPGAWSAFEVLVRAIVGQQISVKAASTLMGRLAQRAGKPVEFGGESAIRFLFPSPRDLAQANLDRIGMPTKRAEALKNIARAIADGAIPFSDSCEPTVGVKEALLEQPGIGPWTAEYVAMRALRDGDAWPGTDLVLRRAIVPGAAERWRPWRAYAAVHLWNSAHDLGARGG